jgi:Putative transposase
LKYLSRYVYRVAIPNHRLVALKDGQVTFRFKDYKRAGQLRTQTLDAAEFLRRFVLHVLPKDLHKVRYFGFLANCHRHQKLAQCRLLLGQSADAPVTTARGPARPPRSPIARVPGSSPVMRVRCAKKVACSWSRAMIATLRHGTCPLPCPIWTPHRGEQSSRPRSRRCHQASRADGDEVRPKPAPSGFAENIGQKRRSSHDPDPDADTMSVPVFAMPALPHRSQQVPRLQTTYIAVAVESKTFYVQSPAGVAQPRRVRRCMGTTHRMLTSYVSIVSHFSLICK